jgi:hypothetical protein
MGLKTGIRPPTAIPKNDREFKAWCREATLNFVYHGTGSPEGVVTADIGSLYLNASGGAATTLYVKTANNGSAVGWTAK